MARQNRWRWAPPHPMVESLTYLFHVRPNSSNSSALPLYWAMQMLAMTSPVRASASLLASTARAAAVPVTLGASHAFPPCFCTHSTFTAASLDGGCPTVYAPT